MLSQRKFDLKLVVSIKSKLIRLARSYFSFPYADSKVIVFMQPNNPVKSLKLECFHSCINHYPVHP
jgi:hypothetical protein